MIAQLTKLYKAQEELDKEIQNNHSITYESTRNKRILALLVEIGEFANTTRTFKFWSLKGREKDEIMLDEFADGLHFLLSLGIDKGYIVDSIEVEDNNLSPTDNLLETYELVSLYKEQQSLNNYLKMFVSYLRNLLKFGFSWEQAENAYYLKLKENHHRQETKY